MKEKIMEVLNQDRKAYTVYELEDLLGLTTASKMTELLETLRELVDDVEVYHTNKDKYMLLSDSHLRKGRMLVNKRGFGFVSTGPDDEDIYVSSENMNGAIHQDTVLVEITSKMNAERLEGRVLKVLKREVTRYVGQISFDKKGKAHIELDDKKIKLNIEIPKDKTMNTVDGHKVVVEIVRKINNNSKYEGKIVEVIGHINDPGVDILSVVYKYNIQTIFPDDVIEQASRIPTEVLKEDMVGRRDLREEEIFTIDGDDTKDIDDAISVKKLDNGNYELGVHIADVSHYVKENTPIDKEALERGTSVYLVDRVIPMIPHSLSNGICSLNPNVDRLAMSCVMQIDPQGNLVDYDIFESVINSKIQMTYKNVNSVIEDHVVPDGYEQYESTLHIMKELADTLRTMKERRGYIDFDVDEAKIIVNEKGKPIDVVLRERGSAEKMIEDYMIAANECVATHIFFMELPFVYRVHKTPEEEKIRGFLGFIGTLGYTVKGDLKNITPYTVQKLIKELKDKPEFKILSSLLLRSMQKAVYTYENIGHFGLASKCYTHFTSPIRRYPDSTVHRLLRTYLFDKQMSPDVLKHWEQKLIYVTEHSSSRERASIDCEREVEDMKMAEYMEDHIGEEYEGIISSVMNFGMFVELDNLIEGLVPIKDMNDFYHFNPERMSLTGERKKQVYSIGDRVLIKVVRASKEDKTIDFQVIRKIKDEETKTIK